MTATRDRDPVAGAAELRMVLGEDGYVREGNAAFAEICGVDPAELTRTSLFEVTHPFDIPVVLESLAGLTRGLASATWEHRMRTPAFGTRHVRWVAEAAADRPGLFPAVGRDVTDERRLDRNANDLDSRLRMALAIAAAGAWDYDPEGDRLWLDSTFATLFGIDAAAPARTWVQLADHVHPEDREHFVELRDHLSGAIDVDTEVRLRPSGAVTRHVAVRARSLDRSGDRPHIIGVAWDITATKTLEAQLTHLAMHDQLTGLPNRRAFDLALRTAWASAVRSDEHLSLLMVDIDDFKAINDGRGHDAGDDALHRVGRILSRNLRRESDVVARYGGEEFVAMLPATDATGALAVARRMVEECRAVDPATGLVTISVGVAHRVATDRSLHDVLRRADAACYDAKRAGKNQAISG